MDETRQLGQLFRMQQLQSGLENGLVTTIRSYLETNQVEPTPRSSKGLTPQLRSLIGSFSTCLVDSSKFLING